MTMSERELPTYLAVALEQAPAPDIAPAGQLAVVAELVRLAQLEPQGGEARAPLEALCRKVHVARRIDACYGLGWKKLDEPQPLDVSAYPLLVSVLLAHAERAAQGDRGLSLKLLNAAAAALDLADGVGASGLEAVRVESDRQLERALAELSS